MTINDKQLTGFFFALCCAALWYALTKLGLHSSTFDALMLTGGVIGALIVTLGGDR